MSFRLRHEWRRGAVVNGAQLSTCEHCSTLRVERPGEMSFASGVRVLKTIAHFIRRAVLEEDRIRDAEPPCVTPTAHFRAPW